MTTHESQLAPGTLVGPYRIDARLGAGGMGVVYAAEEPTVHKRVAIKVLRRAFADDEATVARFEREARAANVVRHPGIVDVFGFGRLPDGRPYLVMSLLEGRSLANEIAARGPLPPREAWALARSVGEALAAAHGAGLVHRDLKPDNVFLEAPPATSRVRAATPRILDFGIAKLREEAHDDGEDAAPMKLTQTGVPIGTPAYMAPEQWWSQGVGPHTDQYAFGVMLFEMLAGRPPFGSAQFVDLMQKHLHEKAPTLAAAGVAAPAAVEAVVARALAKRPDERFTSMDALLEAGDLAFAGASDAVPARVDEAFAPTVAGTAPGATPLSAPTSPTAAGRPATLARFVAAAIGAHVLGALGLVAVGYAGDARRNPREWTLIAGWLSLVSVASFAVALAGITWAARARTRGRGRGTFPFWLALLPALLGGLGTHAGWVTVVRYLAKLDPAKRFEVFNVGMYEANACRFIGFALSASLWLSLVALPGLSGASTPSATIASARGVRLREALAALAGLLLLAIYAGLSGAPSGALVAGTAAACLGLGILFPTVNAQTAVKDEAERALAGLLALALAIGVGFARIEAREAYLWQAGTTRAERAAEIVAADGERMATTALALASVAIVVAIEVVRLLRLRRHGLPLRLPVAGWALAAVIALAAVGDATQHSSFLRQRDVLREELAPQFTLFAKLDPPSSDLSGAAFTPRAAPALQLARDMVALNAKAVLKLSVLDSPQGAQTLAADLSHAIAAGGSDLDLSLVVDREVPWSVVAKLLSMARAAGASHVQFLLTRGAAPMLPPGAPPEVGYVVGSDFVAIPADLGATGFRAEAGDRFGAVAPALAKAARDGVPVALAVAAL